MSIPLYIKVYDSNFASDGLSRPKKEGDVGYDLPARVKWSHMTRIEKILGWIAYMFGKRNLMLYVVWPFMTRLVPSGIHIELPPDVWAKVEPRSSTSRKRLTLLGGIIDSGYRGEYFTVLANLSFVPRIILDNERYAQVIFHTAVRPRVVDVMSRESLNSTDRGGTGFGSTGK